jgi:hypothetical protein
MAISELYHVAMYANNGPEYMSYYSLERFIDFGSKFFMDPNDIGYFYSYMSPDQASGFRNNLEIDGNLENMNIDLLQKRMHQIIWRKFAASGLYFIAVYANEGLGSPNVQFSIRKYKQYVDMIGSNPDNIGFFVRAMIPPSRASEFRLKLGLYDDLKDVTFDDILDRVRTISSRKKKISGKNQI